MPPESSSKPCDHTADGFTDDMIASLPALRRFARSLCRQGDMAEDLVQETMMRAWSSRHTFHPGSNFGAWIFTILRNYFYSTARKRSRMIAWDPEAAERILIQQPEQESDLHVQDIQSAVRELPNSQREMLVMIAGAGMSYEEAAIAANCKIGTVKSRVFRGRAAIRASIGSGEALLPA